MIEKIKRPQQFNNQEMQIPRNIQELMQRYDLDNINRNIYDLAVEQKKMKQKHYSTEEQVIGTWINGKPLYRKTFVCETLGDNVISISDIEEITNITGCINTTYGVTRPLNTFYQDENGFSSYFSSGVYAVSSSYISIIAGEWIANNFKNAIITVEYTKTTD